MANVGLGNVPTPLNVGVDQAFQGLPQIDGVNRVGKGWNEFVLYADTNYINEFGVLPEYYYVYIGMTWDNGSEEVLTEEGAVKGLFIRNYVDSSVEGFYCVRRNNAYYNWLCESTVITEFNFDPVIPQLPINKEMTSWWVCGVEDRNTYTQAQCRQNLVTEDEEPITGRIRYDPELNVEFWGYTFDSTTSKWEQGGVFSLAGAHEMVTFAATTLILVSLSITF